jgi:DNA-binding response OmpR family regulator
MKNGKYVVLCVDDDQDFLDSLKMMIEAEGHLVETAGSAEEGLRRYKASRPDLIVVDLMMEEVDAGANFVKEARALGPTPPIYMLSSVGDSLTTLTDYSDLGLSGVLQKPINPAVLRSTLKKRLK